MASSWTQLANSGQFVTEFHGWHTCVDKFPIVRYWVKWLYKPFWTCVLDDAVSQEKYTLNGCRLNGTSLRPKNCNHGRGFITISMIPMWCPDVEFRGCPLTVGNLWKRVLWASEHDGANHGEGACEDIINGFNELTFEHNTTPFLICYILSLVELNKNCCVWSLTLIFGILPQGTLYNRVWFKRLRHQVIRSLIQ